LFDILDGAEDSALRSHRLLEDVYDFSHKKFGQSDRVHRKVPPREQERGWITCEGQLDQNGRIQMDNGIDPSFSGGIHFSGDDRFAHKLRHEIIREYFRRELTNFDAVDSVMD
jgi:hypothetical protein